jgi:hypothetical protein
MGLTERSEVEAEIAALSGLATDRLRIEWRRLYRTEPPPRLSRDLLLRAVAYKIHERAHGGPGFEPEVTGPNGTVRRCC